MHSSTIRSFVLTSSSICCLFCFTIGSAPASLFTVTSGNLSAQAQFSVSGSQLTVVLTNISSSDVLVPTDVLTAVFFKYSGGAVTFTPVSATLTAGSTVLFAPSGGSGPNVGGEWAYAGGLSGPGGSTQGISSTGLDLFGAGNFNGPNLQGPVSVDGLQYGITSAGDNPLTGNTPVTGKFALIKNSVTLVLNANGTLTDSFTNVGFQYGTALDEPFLQFHPPTVPEPTAFSIWSIMALCAIGLVRLPRK